MAACSRCQAEIALGAIYCAGCGLRVEQSVAEDLGLQPRGSLEAATPSVNTAQEEASQPPIKLGNKGSNLHNPLYPPTSNPPTNNPPKSKPSNQKPEAKQSEDNNKQRAWSEMDSGPLPLPDSPRPPAGQGMQAVPSYAPAKVAPGQFAPGQFGPIAPTKSSLYPIPPGERFPPGSMVSSRYRIVARIGKGGMGEVYRADDLVLSQTVALKFVPDRLAANQAARENFLNEVRIARRVTHPNVCRVYDIGEHEGLYFITMEFVDGEDLSGLIKRFGRLSPDRSLRLAREICAGLASAHEQGVLHRDLKPANILIDGRGRAKIADFGLAAVAEELRSDKRRAGTPAYMAPEVLRGQPASQAGDMYSLGLLLYELFSAQPVYRPQTLEELMKMHDKPVVPLSDLVPEIDLQTERMVMWCLQRDVENRAQGPLAVLAGLPGGDALGAALEAGLTPSPALVAASGAKGMCRPFWIASALAGIVASLLLLFTIIGPATTLLAKVPLPKTAGVLEDRSRDIIRAFAGTNAISPHSVSHLDYYEELVAEMQRRDRTSDRWSKLNRTRPSPVDFWYRQSSKPIVTLGQSQHVTMQDPPFDFPGMISLRLDSIGRLREYQVYTEPEQLDFAPAGGVIASGKPKAEPDWNAVFSASGLDLKAFEEIPPKRIPPIFGEARRAWKGVYPEAPDELIRVEAATLNGSLVAFRIIEMNWVAASMYIDAAVSPLASLSRGLSDIVTAASLVGGIILAWRNLSVKRSDREGAFRVAFLGFVATALAFVLGADWPGSVEGWFTTLGRCIRESFVAAGIFWVFYIALEPYVRRTWPETLITWTRLLTGKPRDPMVCQHIVMGVLTGCVCAVLFLADRTTPGLVGKPPPTPWLSEEGGIAAISGARNSMGVIADAVVFSARWSITFLVVLVLLKLAFKRKNVAVIVYTLLQGTIWSLDTVDSPLSWISFMLLSAISSLMLVRFGLLTLATAAMVFVILLRFPMVVDPQTWFFPSALVSIFVVVALAVYGALGSQGWLGKLPRLASNSGV